MEPESQVWGCDRTVLLMNFLLIPLAALVIPLGLICAVIGHVSPAHPLGFF